MRCEELLSRFDAVKSAGDGKWKCRCPGHEDRDASSLSIALGDDGRVLLHCFAGCSVDEVCAAVGLKTSDLFAERNGQHASNGHATKASGNGALKVHKTQNDASAALLWSLTEKHGQGVKYAQSWPYHSEQGMTVSFVVRFDLPTPEGEKQRKSFRQMRRVADGWVNEGLKLNRPLYRLPHIVKAQTVYVCEGEKAADAGASIGLECTTSQQGSASPQQTDWSPLAGKDVVILPDNDEPGMAYAARVRELLGRLETKPKSVRTVKLPGLPESGDLFDFIESREAAEPDVLKGEIEALAGKVESESVEPAPSFTLDTIDSATFLKTDYRQRFLVKRILVKNQPCMFGGPHKAMKTSQAVDLAFSLGTGTPFLGTFEVPEPVNVMILSGESGGFTLRETAIRVAHARGWSLDNARIRWGFKLPRVSNADHLKALADEITQHSIEVCIIDPAYLCLLAGAQNKQAANVFDMGDVLMGLTEVGQETASTIILLHHLRKNREDPTAIPELEDLAYAGFAEWARQWILVGRRQKYEPGTGHHSLWLNVGGSAGHSGTYAVTIDEGVPDDDFKGRKWELTVDTATDAIAKAQASRKTAAEKKDADRIARHRVKVLDVLRTLPEGATRRKVRESADLNSKDFAATMESIGSDGLVEPCQIVAGNRQKYAGIRLSERGRNWKEPCNEATGTHWDNTLGQNLSH